MPAINTLITVTGMIVHNILSGTSNTTSVEAASKENTSYEYSKTGLAPVYYAKLSVAVMEADKAKVQAYGGPLSASKGKPLKVNTISNPYGKNGGLRLKKWISNSSSKVVGNTRKYIPETGKWGPVGKTRREWLKENNFKEQWGKNKANEQWKKGKGYPYSMDVVDEKGNVVGRIDKNGRVEGKVVPEHVHLNSDVGNIHHWFND